MVSSWAKEKPISRVPIVIFMEEEGRNWIDFSCSGLIWRIVEFRYPGASGYDSALLTFPTASWDLHPQSAGQRSWVLMLWLYRLLYVIEVSIDCSDWSRAVQSSAPFWGRKLITCTTFGWTQGFIDSALYPDKICGDPWTECPVSLCKRALFPRF